MMIDTSSGTPKLPRPQKRHGCLSRILWGGLIFLIVLVGSSFYVKTKIERSWQPLDSASTLEISIQIPVGSGVSSIAEVLEKNHLIQSHASFVLYCRLNQLEQSLQAGNYRFSPSQSLAEIAHIIATGQVYRNSITLPEGFTVEQIGARLIETGLISDVAWTEALQQEYGRDYLVKDASVREPLEGFLFPDTYDIVENAGASAIVEQMLERFDEVWEQVASDGAEGSAQDVAMRDIVTIASLVERECQVESEQARIAGVIYNRLIRGMPLQIDASVLYALGEHKETVLLSDLRVDSPYNTYLYPGLPPGSIACPGEKALYAALHPESHEFLYYVATGDGSHEFSTNFNDHLLAQQKYQP